MFVDLLIAHVCFLGWIWYCTDPEQLLTTADEELDDLPVDHDLSAA